MKRLLITLIAMVLLIALPVSGLAGVTVRTSSNLFGVASVAQLYMDTLVAWENATGNTVEDYSGLPDDMWRTMVPQDLANGIYDVLYYDITNEASAQILDKVVPLSEVLAAYPDAKITINPLAAENDGRVYAVPVSFYWEALYCNKDLFEANNLELPTDWAKLGTAVKAFREQGIPPIAASFSDLPNYLVEASLLINTSAAEHAAAPASAAEAPASWAESMQLLRALYQAGAFGQNALETTEMDTTKAFVEKEAAMQFDGSWFVRSIPEESWDSTVVVPFPVYSASADPTTLIGDMTMGFYITRAAWDDPQRRDAAVSLLQALTAEGVVERLGESNATGALGDSIKALLSGATRLVNPVSERMTADARALWFASIPGLLNGTKDGAAVMSEVLDMGAFGQ